MKYIYISKESAKKGISLIYEVSDKKIENFENYFSERGLLDSVEYHGHNLPHFITYLEETNSVRESTYQEQHEKGHYSLLECEYIDLNNKIKRKPMIPINIVIPEWDNVNFKWIEAEVDIEKKKQYLFKQNSKMAENEREERHTIKSPNLGFLIDCSSSDRENQQIYRDFLEKKIIEDPFKCGDNVLRKLSVEEMDTMILENSALILQIYENKYKFEKLINDAKTMEELGNIEIKYTYSLEKLKAV